MPRLPTPGGDEGNWGTILNEFLEVAHNTDGSPKDEALSTHATLTDGAHNLTDKVDKAAGLVQISAAYTVQESDRAKTIEADGTFTITFPDGLEAGFQVVIVNVGTGVITLAAATTLQSANSAVTLATQYQGCVVYHRGSNVWLAMGGLA